MMKKLRDWFRKDYIGIVFPIMSSEESSDGFIWKFRVYDRTLDYYTHDFEYPSRRMCKKAMKKHIKSMKKKK